eukprot:CAMPEP_0197905550 /NCGR_PEP_ID=MMETSP1439-20131203/60608_1 /TAXON_ID=66791 /ORGANISM="Gonyaulax spinifera, Strain CCMP409" /LENGTH=171 /DNA_ID=CAMNT_0043526833 /DNA_START=89 /DNA_END=602 /DNA_ORIENTATION=+
MAAFTLRVVLLVLSAATATASQTSLRALRPQASLERGPDAESSLIQAISGHPLANATGNDTATTSGASGTIETSDRGNVKPKGTAATGEGTDTSTVTAEPITGMDQRQLPEDKIHVNHETVTGDWGCEYGACRRARDHSQKDPSSAVATALSSRVLLLALAVVAVLATAVE